MSTYSSGIFFTFEDPTLLFRPPLFLLFLRPTLRTADYSGPSNDGEGGRGEIPRPRQRPARRSPKSEVDRSGFTTRRLKVVWSVRQLVACSNLS